MERYNTLFHVTVSFIVLLAALPPPSAAQKADTGCNGRIDTQKLKIRLSPKGSYVPVKRSLRAERDALAAELRRSSLDDALYSRAKTALEDGIVNGLIPFWYGTEWDFYGHTSVPNQGVIACGYFVSTVLQHAGFILNRYTLAQQGGYNEARSIQTDDSVQIYRSRFDGFAQAFKKKNEEGLYFVGLDCHVGFLLYRAGELFFIHSSYMSPLCVVVEKASLSVPFNATTTYTVAALSTNRKLIEKWLKKERVRIRKDQ